MAQFILDVMPVKSDLIVSPLKSAVHPLSSIAWEASDTQRRDEDLLPLPPYYFSGGCLAFVMLKSEATVLNQDGPTRIPLSTSLRLRRSTRRGFRRHHLSVTSLPEERLEMSRGRRLEKDVGVPSITYLHRTGTAVPQPDHVEVGKAPDYRTGRCWAILNNEPRA